MARRRPALIAALACMLAVLVACDSSGAPTARVDTPSHPASSTAHPSPASSPTGTGTERSTSGLSQPPVHGRDDVTARRPTPARPCGVGGHPAYTHVVWIWMENKDYRSVIGSRKAPYENLLARRCGLATNYHGVTHPSLPNYLAATGGATFGVRDDAGPAAHRVAGDSLFGQVARKGLSWRAFEESMTHGCAAAPAGSYAVKHNPAAYFTRIRSACRHDDVPLGGRLARALSEGHLPAFSFITPNLCHDTHDCSVAVGDAWLKRWVTRIVRTSDYRSGRTLVIVTWDEGVGRSNRVPTLVVGAHVPAHARSARRLDHYSLLRATEDVLGLPHLRKARSAHSMTSAFRLGG